jgi:hypothetical protein
MICVEIWLKNIYNTKSKNGGALHEKRLSNTAKIRSCT